MRSREVTLPSALIKLDDHFRKQCRVHNDNKRRREELAKIKSFLRKQTSLMETDNSSSIQTNNTAVTDKILIENCEEQLSLLKLPSLQNSGCEPLQHSTDSCPNDQLFKFKIHILSEADSWLQIDHVTHLNHGIRRLKVDKHFDCMSTRPQEKNEGDGKPRQDMRNIELCTVVKSPNSLHSSNGNLTLNAATLTDISELVGRLTYLDIQYEHTYSEGVEMTLADLILYVYTYHLLVSSCGVSLLTVLGYICVSCVLTFYWYVSLTYINIPSTGVLI